MTEDDIKDEVLATVTDLDRLGYTGGPDLWERDVVGFPYKITVGRTPKGWVVKLLCPAQRYVEETQEYENFWLEHKTHYFKTITGATMQARIYTGLIAI